MTVELALTPDGRWSFPTDQLISSAGAAGFTAVGIDASRVDVGAAEAYTAAGLRCHEVLALVVSDDAAGTLAMTEQLTGAAETMGAAWVLTVFTTALTAAAERTIERCAGILADAGVGMAVEFSPLGTVPTIRDGMEVVRRARRGGGHVGLLIDTWHFCFGDSTWEDLAAVPLEDIAYVQFDDALAPESQERLIRETLHRRALPGAGILELDRFATTLLDRGWDGIVSVEVLSAELRTLPVDQVVRRLFDTTAPYWL